MIALKKSVVTTLFKMRKSNRVAMVHFNNSEVQLIVSKTCNVKLRQLILQAKVNPKSASWSF